MPWEANEIIHVKAFCKRQSLCGSHGWLSSKDPCSSATGGRATAGKWLPKQELRFPGPLADGRLMWLSSGQYTVSRNEKHAHNISIGTLYILSLLVFLVCLLECCQLRQPWKTLFFRWQRLPQPGCLSNPVEQSTWLTHCLRLYMNEKETSSMLPLTFQHIHVVTGVSITLTNILLCKGGRHLLNGSQMIDPNFLVLTPLECGLEPVTCL